MYEIQLPESLKTIGGSAFYNCTGVNGKLILPSRMTSIGSDAFRGCSSLEEIEIRSSLVLGAGAFQGTNGVEKVTLPTDITWTAYSGSDPSTFAGCGAKEIVYTAGETGIMTDARSSGSGANAYTGTVGYGAKSKVENIIFEEGITHIGTPITSMNGSEDSSSLNGYLYWYDGTSYHFDGTNEAVILTLSDGTNKIYVTLAAGQSATLDIENNKVTIDGADNGGVAGDYEIRFSHADDYDTFHDTVIKGTCGKSDTVLQKSDEQIEIQTNGGTNLTVTNEENGTSTGTTTVNLSEDTAVIRNEGGAANVYTDKDGDGTFTDHEQPIVTTADDPNKCELPR